MEVAPRDVRWTEWLRQNRHEIVKDLEGRERQWRSTKDRNQRDMLFARWVSWTLTSTVRFLRDQATRALYWYGLGKPQALFDMAIESLEINDPYVSERLLAAAFGVVMGHQRWPDKIAAPLAEFMKGIAKRLTGPEATFPTNHWMTRVYIQGIVDFATCFLSSTVPCGLVNSHGLVAFAAAPFVAAIDVKEQHTGYLGRDFENYTVGRLIHGRSNHDYEHKEFAAALAEVRGRIWRLGYRVADFEHIDADIGRFHTHRDEPSNTERYVKKYGWIGFYEKAGVLTDAGKLSFRPRHERGNPDVDIDPSFPRPPTRLAIAIPDWTHASRPDTKKWLASGTIVVPDELLRLSKIGNHDGPWIAVDGYLSQKNRLMGRQASGAILGMLVEKKKVAQTVKLLKSLEHLANEFYRVEPSDYYTFAGEMPWSVEFAHEGGPEQYKCKIGNWENGPTIEVLSHIYAWENYHSSANRAGGYAVPSKTYSQQFKLRASASSWRQFDTNGRLAAISLSPPEGCDRDGHLLYLREDLVCEYASARNAELVWVVWGERNLTNVDRQPAWCWKIYERHENYWRRVQTLVSLCDSK